MAWHCRGNAIALPWHSHGNAMAMPWQCHGIAIAMPWHCHGNAMPLPQQCHGIAMALPWQCHGNAMVHNGTPWTTSRTTELYKQTPDQPPKRPLCYRCSLLQGHGIAMALPWQCHGIAMALPWQCHGNAMAMPWYAMAGHAWDAMARSTKPPNVNIFVCPA